MAVRISEELVERVNGAAERYAADRDHPIAGYGALEALYLGMVTTIGLLARRRRQPLPDLQLRDLAVLGVATHRLSRTLTKDPIASPLRMPFTRLRGTSGPAELKEEVVAEGMGHAVGELLTCPFCMGQWVATGFVAGMIFAPRATRVVASAFACVAVSDFLQFAYTGVQKLDR